MSWSALLQILGVGEGRRPPASTAAQGTPPVNASPVPPRRPGREVGGRWLPDPVPAARPDGSRPGEDVYLAWDEPGELVAASTGDPQLSIRTTQRPGILLSAWHPPSGPAAHPAA